MALGAQLGQRLDPGQQGGSLGTQPARYGDGLSFYALQFEPNRTPKLTRPVGGPGACNLDEAAAAGQQLVDAVEQWLEVAKGGWAPSAVVSSGRLMSGVEHLGERAGDE